MCIDYCGAAYQIHNNTTTYNYHESKCNLKIIFFSLVKSTRIRIGTMEGLQTLFPFIQQRKTFLIKTVNLWSLCIQLRAEEEGKKEVKDCLFLKNVWEYFPFLNHIEGIRWDFVRRKIRHSVSECKLHTVSYIVNILLLFISDYSLHKVKTWTIFACKCMSKLLTKLLNLIISFVIRMETFHNR